MLMTYPFGSSGRSPLRAIPSWEKPVFSMPIRPKTPQQLGWTVLAPLTLDDGITVQRKTQPAAFPLWRSAIM